MKRGRLVVITGCMKSGKTGEFIRLLERSRIAGRRVIIFKPITDTRSSQSVDSRNGQSSRAIELAPNQGLEILKYVDDFDVIGIDELQFFERSLIEIIEELIRRGRQVIISGLDTDFRGQPFGIVPALIAMADDHLLLKAVCTKCGSEEAIRTQKLINNQPAPADSPLVEIEGSDSSIIFEPRCRNCWIKPE